MSWAGLWKEDLAPLRHMITFSRAIVSSVVVCGGNSDAHPSTKKLKEVSINRKKTSRARTPMKRENLLKSKEFVGRKKLWGTKRADSAERVTEGIVKRLLSRSSVSSRMRMAA